MAELIDDLKQSLLYPDEDFVKVVEPDRKGSTRMITEREMERIKRASARKDDLEESMRLNRARRGEHEEGDEEDYEEDYDPRMEKITTVLAVVAAVIIGCIVIVLVGRALGLFHLSGRNEEDDTRQ